MIGGVDHLFDHVAEMIFQHGLDALTKGHRGLRAALAAARHIEHHFSVNHVNQLDLAAMAGNEWVDMFVQ